MNKFLRAPQAALMTSALILLGGCSTIGGVADAINPFDKTEAQKKAEQGDVAGNSDRISLISLEDELAVTGTITPDQVVLPAAYANTDWPQVGGNPAHVMQHTGASGPLKKIWSKDVGSGTSRKGRVIAQPVIAGGRIFVMDGKNQVSAYDAATGDRFWEHDVKVAVKKKTRRGRKGIIERISNPLALQDKGGKDKESVGGGVAVANGRVYVTSGLGVVEALDATTGASVWRKRLRVPLHSAPTIEGGRVFAVTDDNELYAFNASDGAVIWTYQGIIESARMLTAPAPAVVGDTVIAPFASGEVVALRVQNGGVLWQDTLTASGRLTPLASLNDISSGPVIADGYVIATSQSGVVSAFDLRTGQLIWSQPAGSLGFPWVAGDFVYMVTVEGEVVCLSKLDGSIVWIQQLPAYKNVKKRKKKIAWAGPIMAGERLLMMASNGQAVTVNPYNGEIISEFKIGASVFASPIIANETVYVMTDEAKLVALR